MFIVHPRAKTQAVARSCLGVFVTPSQRCRTVRTVLDALTIVDDETPPHMACVAKLMVRVCFTSHEQH